MKDTKISIASLVITRELLKEQSLESLKVKHNAMQ
jgi:hypothetical protein